MSATQAAVDVALILCAVVTWVVLWRRDSAQQVQIDAARERLEYDAGEILALRDRVRALEHGERLRAP